MAELNASVPVKPIFLLADSQLLFHRKEDGQLFTRRMLEALAGSANDDELQASYIGASNGDQPEYYDIFEAAMDSIGIERRRHIKASYSAMDDIYLRASNLILLGGGEIATGWEVLLYTEMAKVLTQRYLEGAVLAGVSAGAVQLGLLGWRGDSRSPGPEDVFDTLRLVPAIIDVHDPDQEWERLAALVTTRGPASRGIGIPHGGGLLYHPGGIFEPVRQPIYEVQPGEDGSQPRTILHLPPPGDAPERTGVEDRS